MCRVWGPVADLPPLGEALSDDLRRLHSRLAQMRIFGKLALNARALFLESLAQDLQFGDEPVDVLHRRTGHALQQCHNAVGDQFAVSLGRRRLAPSRRTNSQISASTAASMS